MSQIMQGITLKPYSVKRSGEKIISFSISLKIEKLKAPFRFIEKLYRKSVLNDFRNVFSASVE